jgi:hypothetical protein
VIAAAAYEDAISSSSLPLYGSFHCHFMIQGTDLDEAAGAADAGELWVLHA